MSAFASVYKPSKGHQSFLAREQKRDHKRKRETNNSDEEEEDDDVAAATDLDQTPKPVLLKDETEDSTTPRVPHPVNKTDPFYVAGLSEEDSLPAGQFPHAPLPETKQKLVLEQELALLNPPLYVPDANPNGQDGSLRRRHLNNLTAVLHKCLLNRDWNRASRAWGLILRTEIQGRGVDVRHNGRWLLGGEILMRRTQDDDNQRDRPRTSYSDDGNDRLESDRNLTSAISDKGFRLAREYYGRLTLQYPHMPRQSHATVNALAVYPALFNVWIFEVQDRALRARQQLERSSIVDSETGSTSGQSEKSEGADHRRALRRIVALELEQAISIAQRMDDIMLHPPYDESRELLQLRAMVSLWLSNVDKTASHEDEAQSEEDTSTSGPKEVSKSRLRHNTVVLKEQDTARRIMKNMLSAKIEVPLQLRAFVEDVEQYRENHG